MFSVIILTYGEPFSDRFTGLFSYLSANQFFQAFLQITPEVSSQIVQQNIFSMQKKRK